MGVQKTTQSLRASCQKHRDPSRFSPRGASQRKTEMPVRLRECSEAALGEDHAPGERLRTKPSHPYHSARLRQSRNAKLLWAIPSNPGPWWATDDAGQPRVEPKAYPPVLSRIPHTSGNCEAWVLQQSHSLHRVFGDWSPAPTHGRPSHGKQNPTGTFEKQFLEYRIEHSLTPPNC